MKKLIFTPMVIIFSLCFFMVSSHSATFVVEMKDYIFSPNPVRIKVGDTVKWENKGGEKHTTTSGTNCKFNGSGTDTWDSGLLNPDQTFERVFTKEGPFPYFCIPHCAAVGGMVGTVIVEAGGQPPNGGQTQNAVRKTFIALLNAGQEFFPSNPENQPPDNPSNTLGVAFMTFDEETRELCYSISFTDLVVPVEELEAHFHSSAGPGVAGGVVLPISPSPPGPSAPGSPKTGCVDFDDIADRRERNKQIKNLKKGLFYINVLSNTFDEGEIRGQVLPIQ